MKNKKIQCPYCGAQAVCRPASMVYGNNRWQKHNHLYICSRWPDCDAYVTAHDKDLRPMGTLANKRLRYKRVLAHQALDELRQSQNMDTWAVYLWLQMKLNLSPDQAHIGMFSEEMCDRLITICRESISNHPMMIT